MKNQKIAYLETLDWSASCGGEHYYATLKFKNPKWIKIELEETLTAQGAEYLNKKDKCPSTYKKGDKTLRFSSLQSVYKECIRVCKEAFPEVDLILHGSSASGSVQKAIYGNRKTVNKINNLYKEAEALDYYSGMDNTRMEAIDAEFDKIISNK